MDDGTRSPSAKRARANAGVSGAEFAGIGIQFGLVILIFVFGGVWLDGRLGTSPWFTLIGVFVGGAGGFYSMYRRIAMAQRRETEERRQRRAAEAEGKGKEP